MSRDDRIPMVGIIVPIYNTEEYLEECLDSIVNQTYKKIRIVLVDDGSTDCSFEIAKKYFLQDKRIVLIRKRKNEGIGNARNIGLDYLSNNLYNETILGGGDRGL